MTKLEDEIEGMRLNMINGYQNSIDRLEQLETELMNCDGEVLDKIEDMKTGLRERRGEIVKSLIELQHMIATHPAPRPPAPPPVPARTEFARIADHINGHGFAPGVGAGPEDDAHLSDRFIGTMQ